MKLMENFQLRRTNPLLGGQMKLDLIIDSAKDYLYVSNFNLSPISPNIAYNYKSNDYMLNNSHADNIKQYYNVVKGQFYSSALNSEFYHNWPMICNNDEKLTSYSNIYDYGCRRTSSYAKYNKQFEFLCPLWLENLNNKDIRFKITITDLDNSITLAAKTLVLSHNENNYHNRFVDYIKEYFAEMGIMTGNDNVINIVFAENRCNVTGMNVKSGMKTTLSLDYMVDNILSRERPLIETDSIITNIFSDNEMICSQLFNFNLCFNIEDIMSHSIMNMFVGKNIKISVDTYIGEEILNKRDFYTEYEYIDKEIMEIISNDSDAPYKENVLDYFHDYECVDLIDKNKFCQSVCHWSLNDDHSYIFNVYDGFSGVYKDGEYIYENSHQYGMTPNIDLSDYVAYTNNTGWVNTMSIGSWSAFYRFFKDIHTNKMLGTKFNEKFINKLKYGKIPEILKDYHIISMCVDDYTSITNNMRKYDITPDEVSINLCILHDELEKCIMLISDSNDNLTFKSFYNLMMTLKDNKNNIINALYEFIYSIIPPTMIVFNESIQYANATSPDIHTKELSYFKNSNVINYIFRYDGKIKPSFTENTNTLYYKDYISNSKPTYKFKNTPYYKYGNSNYTPLFPSIKYCAIKKISDWNYEVLPEVKISEFDGAVTLYNNTIEYTWFDYNSHIVLRPNMTFTYENKKNADGTYEDLDNIVLKMLKNYYGIYDVSISSYIKSLYEYENNWEYVSDTNVDDYIYTINIRLK